MERLTPKTVLTRRNMTYSYHTSADKLEDGNTIALVLLHGFRDTSHCWQFVVPNLLELPYRLIIPDLLGHGGTSKPTQPAAYAYHLMVQDIIDIADQEGIQQLIPLGHDHGAVLACRIYNHCPQRVSALITLNVPYTPPDKVNPFNLMAVNNLSTAVFGYPMYEYWNFLTAPDAARVMLENLDGVWEIPHANSFAVMQSLYCVPNAWRAYLTDPSATKIVVKPYAEDSRLKAEWKAVLEKNGFEAPLCWYTAIMQQVQFESDKLIPDTNMTIKVPVLFVGCDGDAACRPETIEAAKKAGCLPYLAQQLLKGVGHWPMYEQPEEIGQILREFLETKFP